MGTPPPADQGVVPVDAAPRPPPPDAAGPPTSTSDAAGR